MGAHKSKEVIINYADLPTMHEETDYQVKTRGPLPDTWQLNITRGKREDELRHEVYAISRKKCETKADIFNACEQEQGMFWTVFNCAEEIQNMNQCFRDQYLIEMDKKRRDMDRNPEWWWQNIYDSNGEIGKQAEWKDELWYEIKFKQFKAKFLE